MVVESNELMVDTELNLPESGVFDVEDNVLCCVQTELLNDEHVNEAGSIFMLSSIFQMGRMALKVVYCKHMCLCKQHMCLKLSDEHMCSSFKLSWGMMNICVYVNMCYYMQHMCFKNTISAFMCARLD